ncbi:hypothetical protein HanPSC8_Chr10g0417921 [Helianthus annuus]|nr:hypothetical protein HanPSC8_Chr10g0417921 [Helianthus annuus]
MIPYASDRFSFETSPNEKQRPKYPQIPTYVTHVPSIYTSLLFWRPQYKHINCRFQANHRSQPEMTQKKGRISWKQESVDKTFLEACIVEVTLHGREGQLRNVIERSYGVLKARFPILKQMAPFSFSNPKGHSDRLFRRP